MITNAAGDVAMVYNKPTGTHVKLGNGHEYQFVTRSAGVCMAWIQPGDVEAMLRIVHQCCSGSNPKNNFRPANQQQVNLWTGIGDGRP
jgi:hypothetical protein